MGNDTLVELDCECSDRKCRLKVTVPTGEVIEHHRIQHVLISSQCQHKPEPGFKLAAQKDGYAWYEETRA